MESSRYTVDAIILAARAQGVEALEGLAWPLANGGIEDISKRCPEADYYSATRRKDPHLVYEGSADQRSATVAVRIWE